MDIKRTSESFKTQLDNIKDLDSLEQLRIRYLGRKGLINQLLSSLKKTDLSERKKIGIEINNLKKEIENSIKNVRLKISQKDEEGQKIDITLPGVKYPKGSLHPTTTAINEIVNIFKKVGFTKSHYPEVEREYFAFEALNMPIGHPARDDFETFFLDVPEDSKFGKLILTPHTSSGQIREMRRLKKPPIRMVSIGKCYRPNWDTTHTPMFHQFEGLCVDENINITNLKGTIEYFVEQFFGNERKVRFRPFHFQFTEPSFEVDITCGICGGLGYVSGPVETFPPASARDFKKVKSLRAYREPFQSRHPINNKDTKCKVCKSGWLELGGAGMVHPNVLKEGGIDPKIYSGWAFGFGVERVYMMREGIKLDDMRTLYSGQLSFLKQF